MTGEASKADLSQVNFEFLASYSKFRRYPGFSSADVGAIAQADAINALSHAGSVWVSMPESPIVAAYLYPLQWDTEHFGMPMYRLEVLSSREATVEQCAALVSQVLHEAALVPGSHVSAEVDIDDYSTVNSLFHSGFELLDLRRTYCTNRMRQDIDFVRMRSRVRHYRPEDFDAVMRLVRTTTFPSRFYRDQFISPDKAAAMYEKWFAGLLAEHGKSANAMVYVRGGEVVACGAVGEKDLSYAGLARKFRTGSLYVGRPDAVGAYAPVLYQLILESIESHGLGDTTVSLNNVTVCRVLEGFRSYKSAAASYSLRKMIQ